MKTISFPVDFVDLRNVPIDIHDIENEVRDFYLSLEIDEDEDVKTQCLDARSFLDSARMLVRNLISIEDNDYLKKYSRAYFFMQENLGRVDKRINEVEADNIDEVIMRENLHGKKVTDSPSLRRYINSLVTCMEHLVYYPIKNAFKKYNEIDKTPEGEKIVKNKDLYLYLLFLELLHSSESIGSITAEKTRGKNQAISPNQTPSRGTEEAYTSKDTPPSLPEEVEIESEEDKIGQNAEDFFNKSLPSNKSDINKIIFEDENIEISEEGEEDESY